MILCVLVFIVSILACFVFTNKKDFNASKGLSFMMALLFSLYYVSGLKTVSPLVTVITNVCNYIAFPSLLLLKAVIDFYICKGLNIESDGLKYGYFATVFFCVFLTCNFF
jgi:hypothetical protein